MLNGTTPESVDSHNNDASSSQKPVLNPYSCLSCRKKRKRCDRVHPCISCRKGNIECVFVPRRPSTRQKTSLSAIQRLSHLEDAIAHLRKDLDVKSSQPLTKGDKAVEGLTAEYTKDATPPGQTSHDWSHQDEETELGIEFGRLAVGDGRSRYITSTFWANIREEVEDLKSLLEEFPVEQDSPASVNIAEADPVSILGLSVSHSSLLELHPAPDKIPLYWCLFKENCDVLIKVLHTPTVEMLVLGAMEKLDHISKGLEALMFAIYFSVVASLTAEECLEILGSDKDHLIHTYKFAMEKALAQARLMETEEMIVLQAFVIFLTSLRNHCSIRLMWTLTSLAVRLARNAGLHRDGTHFNLSPFVVEMRRRLWWAICVLDSRASEDSGYDAAIPHEGIDTRMPLNINDQDLLSGMTAFPEPRVGLTEMTFSIIRFDATKLFRNLQYTSPGAIDGSDKVSAAKIVAENSELIVRHHERVQELLKNCDRANPFCWYIDVICQIVLTKMWLVVYHPYLRKDNCSGLPRDIRNSLFIRSISTIEHWLLLLKEPRTHRWRWLCETYVQWYAMTFILSELCARTQGELVERAWKAIYAALQLGSKIPSASSQIDDAEFGQHMNLHITHCDAYKPLSRLLRKARSARDSAISLNENVSHSQRDEDTRLPLNDQSTRLTFEVASLDPRGVGLGSFALETQGFPSNIFLPYQPTELYQDLSYYHTINNSVYPPVEDDALNWTNWQDFPG
ncbi:fungal-specific transcription factor domain-containing protein [Xylogone sp. PMI_703]|nr:fungal-specific transcription factor domain-containing protein [Xylogone sp. PMI_703]